eukprot:1161090-Pelagomonas_calceolata.AAC.11
MKTLHNPGRGMDDVRRVEGCGLRANWTCKHGCTCAAWGALRAVSQASACGQQLHLWFSLMSYVVLKSKLLGKAFLSWQADCA